MISHCTHFPLHSVGCLRGFGVGPVNFHQQLIVCCIVVGLFMRNFELSAGSKCSIYLWMGRMHGRGCKCHHGGQQWLVTNFNWEIRFSDNSDSLCIDFECLLWWEVNVFCVKYMLVTFLIFGWLELALGMAIWYMCSVTSHKIVKCWVRK